MKKHICLSVFILISWLSPFLALADEGMWIPSLLKKINEQELKARGLQIPVEQIWSTGKPSIKDAIVHFGGGCTAEVVSYEGLIITNHHCGYSQIQSHSTLEHDYLKNGFWAMKRSEELPNPGLTATFIVDMRDVTDELLHRATDNEGRIIQKNFDANAAALKMKVTSGTHYEAVIKPFNYGNSYFLILTETFTDVRLVGAPASAIGKFGGDTDNWMWPRHTGDFSMFRIYAGQDNKPAAYSPNNVPYRPRYALPISMSGVQEGDFTMVFGFPGTTQQYLPSAAVDHLVNRSNPARIKMRETALSIIDADMRSSDALRIKYAAKQARISNAYKKWIGELNGLKRLNAIQKKQALEDEYVQRASRMVNPERNYAALPGKFKDIYSKLAPYGLAVDYYSEFTGSGPEFIRFALGFENTLEYAKEWEKKDTLKPMALGHLARVPGYFKDYNASTDRKLFLAMFPLYLEGTPAELLPDGIAELKKKYKNNWNLLADEIFEKSVFTDEAKLTALLKNFSASAAKKMKADPAYVFAGILLDGVRKKVRPQYSQYFGEAQMLMTDFVDGLMQLFPDKKYWFDANSTLRLAYGVVEGSAPRDGMRYEHYTTIDGMMEKYKPGDEEFDLPQRVLDLYRSKDYGPYTYGNELRVCFTASNQTTGGNSGSPVLDARGYLIGVNFDRSWESTMSDVMYDPERCRNIILDIRYVLFVIDKVAGASHLLKEMELMTPEKIQEAENEKKKAEVLTLTEEIRNNPDNAALLMRRAKVYGELKMFAEAEADLKSAIALQPKLADAYLQLGSAYMDQYKFTEAIKEFDKGFALDKTKAEALLQKGICQSELRKFEDAIKTFNQYIGLNRLDHRGYYNRGLCYYQTGKPAQGCEDLLMSEKLGGRKSDWLRKELCD